MTDLIKQREQAKTYLKTLFGKNEPDETDIMYMLGLMHANVDIVSIALGGLTKEEYDEAFPQSPCDDVHKDDLVFNDWIEKKDDK